MNELLTGLVAAFPFILMGLDALIAPRSASW